MSTSVEREEQSAAARSAACEVLAALYALADQLDELGAELRAEVERRRDARG